MSSLARNQVAVACLLAAATVCTARPASAGFCNAYGCFTNPFPPITGTPGGGTSSGTCPQPTPSVPLGADADPDETGPASSFLLQEAVALGPLLKAEWNADAAQMQQTAQMKFPCYVAFIHGSGVDDSMYRGPVFSTGFRNDGQNWAKPYAAFTSCPARGSPDAQETYWAPPGRSEQDSLTFRAGRQHWGEGQRCMVWRVAYDGKNRTFAEGAMQAAIEIRNFITRYNIPPKSLTIVTHSMGGLVGRFILNNASPQSPYASGYFAAVASRTKAMITIQAPHTGAMVADVVYGEADHALSNLTGRILQMFGVDAATKTRARQSMRRVYVERAAGNGGWLADWTRTTPLYLIGGRDVAPGGGGNNSDDDKSLKTVSEALCYTDGAVNSWGALCSTSGTVALATCAALTWPLGPLCVAGVAEAWSSDNIAGDGFVELDSGLGVWLRDNGSTETYRSLTRMQGAHVPWAIVQHNHNHGRWDLISRQITIMRANGATEKVHNYLGTFIGDNGIDL